MIHRCQVALIAFVALGPLQLFVANSQDELKTVPTTQIPVSSTAPNGSSPTSRMADPSIEKASRAAEQDVAASKSPLEELAWSVGDWVDDGDSHTFEASVKWSKNGAFLVHSFRVTNAGAAPHTGMQIIAWDPAEKRIRSWTFDSRGGFGEESWRRSGDQWSIRKRFTLPDGGQASAVQVMTRVGDDAFRWKSVNRVIDGSLQPDTDEMTIIRKPAEPGPGASAPSAEQGSSKPEGAKQP
jgi:hypothetical protein